MFSIITIIIIVIITIITIVIVIIFATIIVFIIMASFCFSSWSVRVWVRPEEGNRGPSRTR